MSIDDDFMETLIKRDLNKMPEFFKEASDDSFSERFYLKNKTIRARLFKPLLFALSSLHITADTLTNLRLLTGIFSFGLVFWGKISYQFFASLMLASLIVDGIDGSLARYQKTDSDRGKFIDVGVDFINQCLLTISFLLVEGDLALLVAYHILVFSLAVLFSAVKNSEFKKTDWIIRPQTGFGVIFHINGVAFWGFAYFHINIIREILAVGSIIFTAISLYAFFYIQMRWSYIYRKK